MANCKENCIHCNVCPLADNGEYIDEDCLSADCPDYLNKNVVPKSEVERLRFNLEAVLEEIPETKREVAREIFEEIDNKLHDMAVEYHKAGHPKYFAVCEMVHHKVIRPVEKKYTESEDTK